MNLRDNKTWRSNKNNERKPKAYLRAEPEFLCPLEFCAGSPLAPPQRRRPVVGDPDPDGRVDLNAMVSGNIYSGSAIGAVELATRLVLNRVRAENLIGERFPDTVLLYLFPYFEHEGFSAEGTFPGIVTEQGINFLLQKSFARQPPHGTSASCAARFVFFFS